MIKNVGGTDIKPKHRASCHCGAVVLELDLPDGIVDPRRCDCSICRRKGAIVASVPLSGIRIIQGESSLKLYQFNTKTAKHYFCRNCGIHPFIRPRLDPNRWAVNVRCLDDVDLSSLKIRQFDGEHWEDAAKTFFESPGRGAAKPER